MDSRDTRTKRDKLRDMANQDVSSKEAEIAKTKLGPQRTSTVIYIQNNKVSTREMW